MKNFYCSLNGHEYKVTKNVTQFVKEYECRHCKEQFTTSQNGNIVSLDSKRRDINAILEKMHLKKLNRKTLNPTI